MLRSHIVTITRGLDFTRKCIQQMCFFNFEPPHPRSNISPFLNVLFSLQQCIFPSQPFLIVFYTFVLLYIWIKNMIRFYLSWKMTLGILKKNSFDLTILTHLRSPPSTTLVVQEGKRERERACVWERDRESVWMSACMSACVRKCTVICHQTGSEARN